MFGETEIRSFRVDMPDDAIADLRRRIAATRCSAPPGMDRGAEGA